MLISNSKKVLYFHIPKTGGTSISRILASTLRWNDILVGGPPIGQAFEGLWSTRFQLRKHSPPSMVKRVIGDFTFEDYDKFAVVRDPVSRFRSSFNFASKCLSDPDNNPWIQEVSLKLSDSVKNTFRSGVEIENFLQSDFFTRVITKPVSQLNDFELLFVPQSKFLARNQGDIKIFGIDILKLEEPSLILNKLKELSLVGGNVDSSSDIAMSLFKKHLNVTNSNYLTCATKELKSLIMPAYKDDFNYFDY